MFNSITVLHTHPRAETVLGRAIIRVYLFYRSDPIVRGMRVMRMRDGSLRLRAESV